MKEYPSFRNAGDEKDHAETGQHLAGSVAAPAFRAVPPSPAPSAQDAIKTPLAVHDALVLIEVAEAKGCFGTEPHFPCECRQFRIACAMQAVDQASRAQERATTQKLLDETLEVLVEVSELLTGRCDSDTDSDGHHPNKELQIKAALDGNSDFGDVGLIARINEARQ